MVAFMHSQSEPIIAQHPFLTSGALCLSPKRTLRSIPSIIDCDTPLLFTHNARSALQIGLSLLGIDDKNEILVPAYHCPVIVLPIIMLRARPLFYRINEDLSPSITDIKAKITSSTKAIIVIHYFGVQVALSELRDICQRHHIYLIEDCAHCFYGCKDDIPIGSVGDLAIASIWKFFPVIHGGILRLNNQTLLPPPVLKRPSIYDNLKALYNTLESCPGTSFGTSFLHFLNTFAHFLRSTTTSQISHTSANSHNFSNPYLDPLIASTYKNALMAPTLNWIVAHTDEELLIKRRIENYHTLYKYLALGDSATPLLGQLPSSSVPYVLPILARDPAALAHSLRSAGIRILRFGEFLWDDGNAIDCRFSRQLSSCCIQLPIHQSLSQSDIEYIAHILNHDYS